MTRREFLAALVGAAPLRLRAALAQQTEKVRRIGVLIGWSDSDPMRRDWVAAFVEELARLGWADGRDATIKIAWTNLDANRESILAKELVASRPDVLVCTTTGTAALLHQATSAIPIVFAVVADPVGAGLVASFAHPGGNITGFTSMAAATSHAKLFDLLKQIAPGIKRGGIMFNPDTAPDGGKIYLDAFEAAARSLGAEPMILPVRSDPEIETSVGREQGGLVVMNDPFFAGAHMETVVSATRRNNVPAIYEAAPFAARGGLMSYGADRADILRHAAGYVDRILRGDSPADLPVQTPSKFKLTINLTTAKALGLEIPPSLLAAADEVIE